jgi:hypothetical protein
MNALREIANLVDLPGPMGDDPKRVIENVRGLRENYNRICDRLQTCVQEHRLGLGGEYVDALVVEALNDALSLLTEIRRVTALCHADVLKEYMELNPADVERSGYVSIQVMRNWLVWNAIRVHETVRTLSERVAPSEGQA